MGGAGTVALTGGTLTLANDAIANLQLNAGSLNLAPGFQGGTITNLTVGGTVLNGSNTVTGTLTSAGGFAGPIWIRPGAILNWTGGEAKGPMTVTGGAFLNLQGSAARYLEQTLTNFGTVTWTGSGGLSIYNNNAGYRGAIWNMPGALFNVATDQSVGCACYGYEFINNQGTFEKSAGTGSTYISVQVTNTGTMQALEGTLYLNSGGNLGGVFNAALGAAINFNSGNFTVGAVTLNGPGPLAFTGGTLTLLNDVLPNLQFSGGTLALGPGFQGGTITNLTLGGTTLSGTNVVSGALTFSGNVPGPLFVANGATVNWMGGTVSAPLTVSNGGFLNLGGSGTKYIVSPLTNAGTITYSSGGFSIYNNNAGYQGAIWNEPGAVFNIAADVSIGCACYGYEFFHNEGLLEKTGGTGASVLSAVVTNWGRCRWGLGRCILTGAG